MDVAERRQATVDKFYDKRYLVLGLILEMVVDSIQQELLAKKSIDKWTSYTLWDYLKDEYTIKNTASQWDVVQDLFKLHMDKCKNFGEYRSKYYNIKKQGKDVEMDWDRVCLMKFINSLSSAYAPYLLILQDRIRSDKDFSEEAIMKALQDYSSGLGSNPPQANAATTNQSSRGNINNNRGGRGGNNNSGSNSSNNYDVCKKCGSKHKSDLECYTANDICGKCNRKGHNSRVHEAWQNAQKPKPSNNDGDKPKKDMNITINCATINERAGDLVVDLQSNQESRVLTDNTPTLSSTKFEDFESTLDAELVGGTDAAPTEDVEDLEPPPIKATTNINHVGNAATSSSPPTKICIDSGTTAHLISNREFIQNYYEVYDRKGLKSVNVDHEEWAETNDEHFADLNDYDDSSDDKGPPPHRAFKSSRQEYVTPPATSSVGASDDNDNDNDTILDGFETMKFARLARHAVLHEIRGATTLNRTRRIRFLAKRR